MERVSSVTFIRKEGSETENRIEKLSGTAQKNRSKIACNAERKNEIL